ncbi:GM16779 [Drosophila sechellia]|uniref:GM16779 n=1 Tax=Drosophila sechellia TaxID=7238 RepID=B4ID34_DROSE|nr:GM16779 [Drosophila sechellia]
MAKPHSGGTAFMITVNLYARKKRTECGSGGVVVDPDLDLEPPAIETWLKLSALPSRPVMSVQS